MAELTSNLDLTSIASIDTKVPFKAVGGNIAIKDFKRFASTTLIITSIFAALIVSNVKTGTIKNGIKNIPVYVVVSFAIYLFCLFILDRLFAGIV